MRVQVLQHACEVVEASLAGEPMPPHAMPYRQATVCRQQGLEYGQPSNLTPLEQCASPL